MSEYEKGSTLCFIRRHWMKFLLAFIVIIVIIITTFWAARRTHLRLTSQDEVRRAILECTTPGTPGVPHPCFEQVQLQSRAQTARAIEFLAIDNDCRLRRTLWGLPAPEDRDSDGHLIPCPQQTPTRVYPGDGTRPPL